MKYTIVSIVAAAVLLGIWGLGGEKMGKEMILPPAVTSSASAQKVFMPTAFCKDVTLDLDGMGSLTIAPSHIDNGSTDTNPFTLSVLPSTFDCSSISSNPNLVTLTVDAGGGSSDNCTANVTLRDVTPPTALCKDITVSLNASTNSVVINSALINDGSSDACGISSISIPPTTFDCDDVSIHAKIVTLKVTDNHGNNATCPAEVHVQDNIAPTAKCQATTVFLDANGDATLSPSDMNNGSSDNCSLSQVSLSLSQTQFVCSEANGSTQVTMTVTDLSGNTSTCNRLIRVEDPIPPNAICHPNRTVQLNTQGTYTLQHSFINNNSTDNCSPLTYSLSETNFTCDDVGSNIVTLTVADKQNSSTCTSQVIVEDNISPFANCKNNTIILDASGNFSLLPSDINNGSNDNCDFRLSVSPSAFDCASKGPNMVTLNVTDSSGNVNTCTSTVTVVDGTPPIINCHQAITVYLDANGDASITTNDVNDGSSDVCDGLNLSLSLSQSTFDCSHVLSANPVELTVEDNSQNTAKCNATITVKDTTSPVAFCRNDTVIVNLDANGNGSITTVSVRSALPSDNCTFGSSFESLSNNLFDCDSLGTRSVTYTVTDASNNTASCQVMVEVVDLIPPSITCPGDVMVTANSDCEATLANYMNAPTTSDNCDSSPDISQSPIPGSTIMGTSTITLFSTDNEGNTSTCTFRVIIEDNTPPQVTCKDFTLPLDANGNATLLPQNITASQQDNCTASSALEATVTQDQFTCADLGPNTIELIVEDANQNSATCDATVTVVDDLSPTPQCEPRITLPVGPVTPMDLDADVDMRDNCTVTDYTVAPDMLTCDDVATEVSVVLTVTDNSGNTATCITAVSVEDSSGSQVTHRVSDIIRCGEQLIDWELPTAELPCSRQAELTYMTNPSGLEKGGPFPVGTHTVTYDLLDALVSKSLFDTFLVEILPIPIIENYVIGDTITTPANETVTLAPMADVGGVGSVAYGWKVTLSENIQASPALPIGLQEAPITQNFSFINPRATGIAVYTIFPYYIDAVYPDTCPGDSVVVVVKILPENIDFFIPDMFTPNGDGVNETWGITVPPSINPEDYGIEVFNKAGGLVFRASSLQARWDGDRFPDGPYWYIIVENNSGERIRSGSVTIQR